MKEEQKINVWLRKKEWEWESEKRKWQEEKLWRGGEQDSTE